MKPSQPVFQPSSPFQAAGLENCPPHSFCEMMHEQEVRKHWQPLYRHLEACDAVDLRGMQQRARRMRHEDGTTYNPFGGEDKPASCWPIDVIPYILKVDEWRKLEAGVIQRARLLEAVMADIYGPQQLLKRGILPAELVYSNPHFYRSCYGADPVDDHFLSCVAMDLYRTEDGSFRVWRDYGGYPSGLGFALENRIVTSRIIAELYQQENVLRLAPFFHTFQQHLAEQLTYNAGESGIVLLSPGPDSDMYFEHAFLSRYLGYPLVESQDLTVRNGKVYLKKLAGLERVEIILRHLADGECDPFATRRVASAGIPGLIQAVREKTVRIINTLGSIFIDTPALSPFYPSICSDLLGEELLLPAHESYWCGDDVIRASVAANMDQYTIHNAMAWDRTPHETAVRMLQETPYNCVARTPLRPSSVPSMLSVGVGQSYLMLRLFLFNGPEGFMVMPGALALSSSDPEVLATGNVADQRTKDVWVVSESHVEPFSMIEGLNAVGELRRSSDLPSRVADNLLWLGRYLERAENTIRLLRGVYRRIMGETRPQDIPELPFLIRLLYARGILTGKEYKGGLPPLNGLVVHLHDALFRQDYDVSVANILHNIQQTARKVRDRLSADSWRVINHLDAFVEDGSGDPLELVDETLFILNSFSGLAMESMTRGLGWRFLDMGRRIERAMNLVEILDTGLHRQCAGSSSSLEALLEIADSIMTYRSRYRASFQLSPVLDLLLADETNPKSLGFQLNQIAMHVDHLPKITEKKYEMPEEKIALSMLTAVRLLDLQVKESDEGLRIDPLFTFFSSISAQLVELSQSITAHYLSRVPVTPHYSVLEERGTE